MKRFTPELTADDHEFEIGGEVFKWKQPYWEDIANVLDRDVAAIAQTNGDPQGEGEEKPELPDTVHSVIEDFIKRIELFLDPENDAIKRWRSLAKRKTDPVPYNQFRDVHQWLLEVTSGRHPTELSQPSEAGQS